jgi:TolA-binding protein
VKHQSEQPNPFFQPIPPQQMPPPYVPVQKPTVRVRRRTDVDLDQMQQQILNLQKTVQQQQKTVKQQNKMIHHLVTKK